MPGGEGGGVRWMEGEEGGGDREGEKMTQEGGPRRGDCVTESKVHRCVRNALKTDIKT